MLNEEALHARVPPHYMQIYGSGSNLAGISKINANTSRNYNANKTTTTPVLDHSQDKNVTWKYINTRIYEQDENVNEKNPKSPNKRASIDMMPSLTQQHHNLALDDLLTKDEIMRPKFLGGQFTSKYHDKGESAVKEFLKGQ